MAATYNASAIQAAGGKLYLVASPTTVVGVTPTAIVKELFENFFVNGDVRDTFKGGVTVWTIPDGNGLKAKLDVKPIKQPLCTGAEITIGYEYVNWEAEIGMVDLDVQKWKDICSGLAGHVLTTPKSTTQEGRETFMGGGQRTISRYMALYRWPSLQVPGTFRHILVPNVVLVPSGDIDHVFNKARNLKIKLDADPFDLLPDPATGLGVLWIEDYVTALRG